MVYISTVIYICFAYFVTFAQTLIYLQFPLVFCEKLSFYPYILLARKHMRLFWQIYRPLLGKYTDPYLCNHSSFTHFITFTRVIVCLQFSHHNLFTIFSSWSIYNFCEYSTIIFYFIHEHCLYYLFYYFGTCTVIYQYTNNRLTYFTSFYTNHNLFTFLVNIPWFFPLVHEYCLQYLVYHFVTFTSPYQYYHTR